jgi:hypothetical protein
MNFLNYRHRKGVWQLGIPLPLRASGFQKEPGYFRNHPGKNSGKKIACLHSY